MNRFLLESLSVQDQHDSEETAEQAARFRTRIHDILDELTGTAD